MSAGRLQLARPLVPAYVVHPRVETVEADAQGYHWTGCRLAEERPRVVLERERLRWTCRCSGETWRGAS